MTRDDDEFEGIDINGPWGGVRIGSGGVRVGREVLDNEDPEVRAVRRRVRRKLDLYRHIATYVLVVGTLALLDWATGGGWWVQWLAVIWGAFIVLQFAGTFVAPAFWGREAEERMVQQELDRRRGRVHVERTRE
jgi:hypothetical protein